MSKKIALLEKAKSLNESKEYTRVLELLSDETLLAQNTSELYVEKAIAYGKLDFIKECEEAAQKAIELDENNSRAYNSLGNVNFLLTEFNKSIEFYTKAININPNFHLPYIGIALVYNEQKDYIKAEKFFIKAIQIEPSFSEAYYGLGNLYFSLNDIYKAKSYYLLAIEKNNSLPHPYYGLGNVYFKQKDFLNAKDSYLKANKIDQNAVYPIEALGSVYFKLNDLDKAEQYYLKVIEKNQSQSSVFYNLGLINLSKDKLELAKQYFLQCVALEFNKNSFYIEKAWSKIDEIEKLLKNSTYHKVNSLITKIKRLLLYTGTHATHYTSITSVQFLVLKQSFLRLSEGSFLNDTSEGQELFDFLEFANISSNKCKETIFLKRPFIGSFVEANKSNDLTLWRMYGKEELEEAKGCSLTFNIVALKNLIREKLNPNSNNIIDGNDDIEFYRVAYRNESEFDFAGASDLEKEELTCLLNELNDVTTEFGKKKIINEKEKIEIIELLNQISYLFKSVEFKYENEIRLVINEAIGFEKRIDFDKENFKIASRPPKVFIELVPILNLLSEITIGPKVVKAEEWAAAFHYHLLNNGLSPKINISTLPFK